MCKKERDHEIKIRCANLRKEVLGVASFPGSPHTRMTLSVLQATEAGRGLGTRLVCTHVNMYVQYTDLLWRRVTLGRGRVWCVGRGREGEVA